MDRGPSDKSADPKQPPRPATAGEVHDSGQLADGLRQRDCIVSGIDEEEQAVEHEIERDNPGQNAEGTSGVGSRRPGKGLGDAAADKLP